jgi:hypothetical protein
LTADACAQLDAFAIMRKGSFVARLRAFATSPMRRQTFLGSVALLIAILLRKV